MGNLTLERSENRTNKPIFRRLVATAFASFALAPAEHSLILPTDNIPGYHSGGIEKILIALLLYFGIAKAEECGACLKTREKRGMALTAFLFALTLMIGGWTDANHFSLLTSTSVQHFITASTYLIGWSLIAYYALSFLFAACRTGRNGVWERTAALCAGWMHYPLLARFAAWMERAPLRASFISIVSVWLLILLISYPGLLHGDAVDSLCSMTPELPDWQTFSVKYCSARQLTPELKLNTHHPIFYTLFFSLFIKALMAAFHSFNFAVFIYTLFQVIVCAFVVALSISVVAKYGKCPSFCLILLVLYYAFHPLIQNYVILTTKDVFYSSALHLFLLSLFVILVRERRKERIPLRMTAALTGSALLFILLRNEGVYIMGFFALLVMIVSGRWRKTAFCLLISCLAVHFSLQAACNAYHVNPGSKREMLSVPLQQTARYCIEHRNEVTEDEMAAVRGILSNTDFEEFYTPHMSDAVKNKYIETAGKEELNQYFRAWWQMFLKHPQTYLEATLSNIHCWVYPCSHLGIYDGDTIGYCGNFIQNHELAGAEELGYIIHYPFISKKIGAFVEHLRKMVTRFSFGQPLIQPSTYVWGLVVLLLFAWVRRSRAGVLLLAVPLIMVPVLFCGPCNGWYVRYIYPLVSVFPLLVLMLYHLSPDTSSDAHE